MRVLLLVFCMVVGTALWADEPPPGLICLDPPYQGGEVAGGSELVRQIVTLRRDVDGFPSLADALETARLPICLSSITADARGYLDVDAGLIVLRRDLSFDLKRAILIHELRHLDQFLDGTCPRDTLAMKEHARAVFALEADAQAITTLVAWSLQEAGDPGPWASLQDLPEYGDIAEAFAAEMAAGRGHVHAVTAAFTQWYASEDRVMSYYVSSCSDYLDRQDAAHRLPAYGLLETGFFGVLCRMPDGAPYPCDPPD